MIFALAALAQEEPFVDTGFDMGCSDVNASSVVPADGSTDVPVDLRPVLATANSCSGDIEPPFTFRLSLEGELIHEEVRGRSDITDRQGPILFFQLHTPLLEPNTQYVLEVLPAFGSPQVSTFRTGAGRVAPSSSLPTIAATVTSKNRHFISASVNITPAAPWEFVILRGSGNPVAVVNQPGTVDVNWNINDDSEACMTAIERTVDGRFVGPTEGVCERIGCGCSSAEPWLGGLLSLVSRRH